MEPKVPTEREPAGEKPRVQAIGVLHWAIPVNDLEVSKRFYSEVLGMRYRDNLGPDIVCMACGDPPQNVLLCKRPAARRTTKEEAGSSHYAFVISSEDFDRAIVNLDKWVDEVVLPDTPNRPGHWREGDVEFRSVKFFQGRSMYFLDPTGNTLEICDLLPGQG
jgi:catechol 2,3-dioxygenase-like lactoylglutathione lyase family enzyme